MSNVVYGVVGLGIVGVGGYFALKYFQAQKTTGNAGGAATPPQPVNYTPPSGGPSTQDQIASAVGGVGGLAVGSYVGGPVGGIVGAKVGQIVAPLATKAGIAGVSSTVKTQVAAVRGLATGVSQIAHGDVISGTKSVVTSGLKSAAAPITSGISAIRSLF